MKNNSFNINQIKDKFNRHAKSYDQHAILFQTINQQLLARLDYIKTQPQKILVLGCATGQACLLLAEQFKSAEIIGIDCAIEMLKLAKQKTSAKENIKFIASWMETLPFQAEQFDLIISNSALSWCNNLLVALLEVQRVLKQEGLVLFSTFGPDTLKEIRQAWSEVDHHAHVHTFLDMHDVGDRLLAAGLSDPVMDTDRFQLQYQSIEQGLQELKALGITNILNDRKVVAKDRFKRFERALRSFYTPEKKLLLTFEIAYGHAWKSAKALTKESEFYISLALLKKELSK